MIEIINTNPDSLINYESPKVELDVFAEADKTIRNNVLKLTKHDPTTLKNDLLLYIKYLKLTGQAEVGDGGDEITIRIKKDRLFSIIVPESVSRARRDLYKDGDIVYDDEITDRRKKRRSIIRDYYG